MVHAAGKWAKAGAVWVHLEVHAHGQIREKQEVLVALSKNGINTDDEETIFPD